MGLVAAATLLGAAPAAMADSASMSVTTADGRADPVAYVPRVFTLSGTTSASQFLYVKHRPAGGAACAPSAFTDSGTWFDPGFYSAPVSGAFSFQKVLTWRSPGTWLFCFWLAPSETTITTPIAQAIVVRSSTGAIGATVSPAMPRPEQRAQVTVAGTSEAARQVYAKVRPWDEAPCAPTFDADPGSAMIGGWGVDGAFSIKAYTSQPRAGRYLICMWLAGASDDALPVAGPVAQTFDVLSGPAVVAAASTLDCRRRRTVTRVRAKKVRSVCIRYRFSRVPPGGARMTTSYVTPSRRTYKTVQSTWTSPQSQTFTSASLPARAYRHRRGTWRAVLRIGGRLVKTSSFRVS